MSRKTSLRLPLEPLSQALADVLREHREAQGLTMYALAKRAGISREMLGLIESQCVKPTFDMVDRICKALGIAFSAVVFEAEQRV